MLQALLKKSQADFILVNKEFLKTYCILGLVNIVFSREWMGGRAVEGTGLENRRTGDRTVGSNPTPSATLCLNFCKRECESI